MGMEMVGSILASASFVLKLPVALARAPDKIAYGSGGRVEEFTFVWTLVNATMAEYTLACWRRLK